ncbi:DISARM system helicase DrmA [Mesorhizobium sp. RP14(2022)]|uniref:DISARM system helicase DrmA n=1 Tax=Mesorhizobium liriopis TaxID=2953882 RepID=A0ABT1C0K6_9HYPH|nr:DISARM system helicase DrmA [Mesorhizobium liriopis]MCO6048374.1 DISARM system helicase DrmA [Mesorhizobium liriopis]
MNEMPGNVQAAAPARSSAAIVRENLIDLLRRDLIGPHPSLDQDLEREVLREKPSRWYVSGFIVPAYDGEAHAKKDDDEVAEDLADDLLGTETLDGAPRRGDLTLPADEDEGGDAPPRDRFLPSSIGLTVVLPVDVETIAVHATWGDYKTEPPLPDALIAPEALKEGEKKPKPPEDLRWVRLPGNARLLVDVTRNHKGLALPGSAAPQRPGGGLGIAVNQRLLTQTTPEGRQERLRVVTVFLVNRRARARAPYTDLAYAFQARLELECEAGFHPRTDRSAYHSSDFDLRLGDLHYHDVCEFAVGRNTSAGWAESHNENGTCSPVTRVWTEPLPCQDVEKVAPNSAIAGVEFRMEALSQAANTSGTALTSVLRELPRLYGEWQMASQALLNPLAPRRRQTAEMLLANMESARKRIEGGIALLDRDASARNAFAIMNEAMAMAARQREAGIQKKAPAAIAPPTWRPFQLAFILLNLVGLTERDSPEREIVDLLFFPTGGGKTEAYLGLAAYSIALRRLHAPGPLGAGVSVIMRYTLRLLTLDQLGRAAGLICALELIRTRDKEGQRRLGEWPIEIGLWVGGAASPNRLRPRSGSTDPNAATTWLARYQRDPKKEKSPVPLKTCPWCATPLKPESFRMHPNRNAPDNLLIKCENADCAFTRDRALPVLVVDEPIYRRLPAFLIATVDKFAALPWIGQSGAFFGHVDRFDPAKGFYGAAERGLGRPLDNGHRLDPPDLIIQDELHLISGPLGTVAGLYETVIDVLASRPGRDKPARVKIVASTATVRRAENQIRALFDRRETAVFPPPGIDRRDSFFARTVPAENEPARRYIGLAAQGRGPKLLFLRAMQTLLSGAEAQFLAGADEAADPYLTVLTYFNALRELGGARRIVEDEIREHVASYGDERRRLNPADQPFANRVLRMPTELTSRVSTDDVATAKDRLGRRVRTATGLLDDESMDVALATNMISVGLDITRLGLMVVQGQPKTAAEYIQATSRVGRQSDKPGLVATLLNLHKPRDRTHYESFRTFHASFYRAVEATSVTPFAPRALDRALAALVVAVGRHLEPGLSPSEAVAQVSQHASIRAKLAALLRQRAQCAGILQPTIDRAVRRAEELVDDWEAVAITQTAAGAAFTYDSGSAQRRLLQYPLDPDSRTLSDEHQRFSAGRSMRDVEYGVVLKLCDPLGRALGDGGDLP